MSDDLLPCPFCGGRGVIVRRQRGGTGASGMEPATVYAGCPECDVWFTGGDEQNWSFERRWYDNKENAHAQAITAWNTRVPHAIRNIPE